uniref:Uncharacterized protein n=1 Tax=Anguilla anguilla TaxID=7936 RepID=A0A0E9TVJ9_ANGAN
MINMYLQKCKIYILENIHLQSERRIISIFSYSHILLLSSQWSVCTESTLECLY